MSTISIKVFVIMLFLMASGVLSKTTNTEECNCDGATLVEVEVSGCDGLERCPLTRSKNISVAITFQVTRQIEQVSSVIMGQIGPLFLPFQKSDGCKNSGLVCPLVPGESYTYTNTVPIRTYYPTINVGVRFQLKAGESVFLCVLVPSVIV